MMLEWLGHPVHRTDVHANTVIKARHILICFALVK